MKFRKTGWIKEGTYDAKNPLMGEHQIHKDSHNVITSLREEDNSKKPREGWHLPVIDLDFGCELYPSSTPGHYHLYLNRAIPWDDYVILLNALCKVGYIQRAWCDSALREGQSVVRIPGHVKEDATRRILTPAQKIRLRELEESFELLVAEIHPEGEDKPTEILF